MKTKYSLEVLQPIVEESTSMRQVLQKLGLRLTGGNQTNIKKIIVSHAISTEHFLGQGHMRGKKAISRVTPADYLKVWDRSKPVTTDRIKKWMFRDGVKEKKCENCGLTEWLGKPIPLAVHHKDGDRWNNTLDNLDILCYNCHGQTENYSGKQNADVVERYTHYA